LKQSPININKLWDLNKAFVSHDNYIRFDYNNYLKNPEMKVTVTNKKFQIEVADPTKSLGQLVVHSPENPKAAYSYALKKINFKLPSEHSIDYMHYPLEIQLEHHLDLLKSLIWPANATRTNIKRIAIFALLAQSTGSTSNPFVNSLFP